jgi:hypothetical protein
MISIVLLIFILKFRFYFPTNPSATTFLYFNRKLRFFAERKLRFFFLNSQTYLQTQYHVSHYYLFYEAHRKKRQPIA